MAVDSNKTRFLFDDNNKLIGRVTGDGTLLTENGNPSVQFIPTKRGFAVNRSHLARAKAFTDN